jgi:hypothetical protein
MVSAMPVRPRLITLSRDGTCDGCGRPVSRGEQAWWVPGKPTVTCLVCRPAPTDSAVAGTSAPPPEGGVEGERHERDGGRRDVAAGPAGQEQEMDRGVAGRSALGEYQRRHANREQRIRQRWGRLAGLVLALSDDPQSTRAWQRGSTGENRLAQSLAKLERDDVVVLHDRRVPGSRANIDHLVVCPSGVFVVDAKLYTGEVHVKDVGGLFSGRDLRLFVGHRDCTGLATAMAWQVAATKSALSGAEIPVSPVLCFIDAEWSLLGGPREFMGVLIDDERSLKRRVARAGELELDEIRETAMVLAQGLPAHPV